MKLKEAVKVASVSSEGVYKYIAVDEDNSLWAYESKPVIDHYHFNWTPGLTDIALYVGEYTGSKYWEDTLTVVKHET